MNTDSETPSTFARRLGLVHQQTRRGKAPNLNYLTWENTLDLAIGMYWTKWCRRNTR